MIFSKIRRFLVYWKFQKNRSCQTSKWHKWPKMNFLSKTIPRRVMYLCLTKRIFWSLRPLEVLGSDKTCQPPSFWNPVLHLQKHKYNKINIIGKQSTIIYQQKCWYDIRLGNWVSLLSICNILFWCKLWFISCIPTSIILNKINVFMVFMVFILFEFNFMCYKSIVNP